MAYIRFKTVSHTLGYLPSGAVDFFPQYFVHCLKPLTVQVLELEHVLKQQSKIVDYGIQLRLLVTVHFQTVYLH